jgi:hypothetical protein
MFRPKDKSGFFIYTETTPYNGMHCAKIRDERNNSGMLINIDYEDFRTDNNLYLLATIRHESVPAYMSACRGLLSKDMLHMCEELRYCYSICDFILIIRKKPIFSLNGELKKEKYRGFYFIRK